MSSSYPVNATTKQQLRVKLEGLERLLTGLDAAALVRSRPSLLGFNVRTNLSTKVSRLRALLGPDVDLSTAVARCPSLLSMGSTTVAAKVKTLQESLPPGLDARCVCVFVYVCIVVCMYVSLFVGVSVCVYLLN